MPDDRPDDLLETSRRLAGQRARLRFLRDEGLEILALYRSLASTDDRDTVMALVMKLAIEAEN